jgi:hypothetical protein
VKPSLGLLLGSACLLAPQTASAQAPYSRPAVSPYLNLLRGDSPAGINYYGIIRPEVDFRSSIQRLQQQAQATQQAFTEAQTSTVPSPTGHAAGFMNHNTYFQSFTGGAAGGSFGTTGNAARPGNAPRTPPASK